MAGRLIDNVPNTRTKPMKVLVLGMPWTGTAKIHAALSKSGLHTYHMSEVWGKPEHYDMWSEAIRAKYFDEGKSYSPADFDKLLSDYQALTDLPCALFADELIAAFPDAKVVLSLRDPDSWYKTMRDIGGQPQTGLSWSILTWLDKAWYRRRAISRLMRNIYAGNSNYNIDVDMDSPKYIASSKEKFVQHNEHVREIVPADKLLEYKTDQGWQPLFEFLEMPVPREEIVEKDYAAAMRSRQSRDMDAFWRKMYLQFVLPVGVAAGVYLWFNRGFRR